MMNASSKQSRLFTPNIIRLKAGVFIVVKTAPRMERGQCDAH